MTVKCRINRYFFEKLVAFLIISKLLLEGLTRESHFCSPALEENTQMPQKQDKGFYIQSMMVQLEFSANRGTDHARNYKVAKTED